MRHLPFLVLGLGAVTAASCCPSLWLTITEDPPAPKPVLGSPKIEAVRVPGSYYNRDDICIQNSKNQALCARLDVPAARRREDANPPPQPADRLSSYGDSPTEVYRGDTQSLFGLFSAAARPKASPTCGLPDLPTALPTEKVTLTDRDCYEHRRCTIMQKPGFCPARSPSAIIFSAEHNAFLPVIGGCQWLEPAACRPHVFACPVTSCQEVCNDPNAEPVRPGSTCERRQARLAIGAGIERLPAPPDGGPVNPGDLDLQVALSPSFPSPYPVLLTFFHLADMQLRDPAIRVGDWGLSHQLDGFIPSFEYDRDMEQYQQFVVEALLETMNAEIDRCRESSSEPQHQCPAFALHGGDSIDSGTMRELELAHGLLDRLHVPFYNQLGNHDVHAFGNLIPTGTRDSDADCATIESVADGQVDLLKSWVVSTTNKRKLCVDDAISCPSCPVGMQSTLVAKVGRAHTMADFMRGFHDATENAAVKAVPSSADDVCTLLEPTTLTRQHGFDLYRSDHCWDHSGDNVPGVRPCGYYVFSRELPPLRGNGDEHKPRRAIFVVLNTEELSPDSHGRPRGGTKGMIGAQQVEWLTSLGDCLRNRPRDLVFVFGHQPISNVSVEVTSQVESSAEQLLSEKLRPIAYFYGDKHAHAICTDRRDGRTPCGNFWEIETSSLLEFPQEARMVRIRHLLDDIAFLELTTFRENLAPSDKSGFAELVKLGRRGAERDYCSNHPDKGACTEDLVPVRTDGFDSNARLFFRLPR